MPEVNLEDPLLTSLKASRRMFASNVVIVSMNEVKRIESGMVTEKPSKHCPRLGKTTLTGGIPDTMYACDITTLLSQ